MSACEQARRLSAYHDGELSGSARASLEAHLRQCPACAAELDRLRKLSRLLGSAVRPGIPPQVLARLHRAADVQPAAAVWRMAQAVTAVAASILLVCAVWLWAVAPAANATGPIPLPLWETAAVSSQTAPAMASEEQLAMWIVEDLSWRNGHD